MNATITFRKLIQDSQDYESFDQSDDHMISRVFFTLTVAGQNFECEADVKQPYGTKFEGEELESSPWKGWAGPRNHHAFCDLVDEYVRGLVGSQGRAIHIEGATSVRMHNNIFVEVSGPHPIELPDN